MIKNNLKGLLCHVLLSILMLQILNILTDLQLRDTLVWNGNLAKILTVVSTLLASSCYILIGKYLRKQDNELKNVLSVSLVGGIGLLLMLGTCLGVGTVVGAASEWIFYIAYIGYASPLVLFLSVENLVFLGVLSIVPSMGMYIGLRLAKE